MKKDNQEQLLTKRNQLRKDRNKLKQLERQTSKQLSNLEVEFHWIKSNKFLSILRPSKMKRFIRTIGAYALGRRNWKNVYSKTYKSKKASNDLKKYRYALYNEGFTKKTEEDLRQLFVETNNKYLKRAIAWELVLWYSNRQTREGAEMALHYLNTALKGEKDIDERRRKAIVASECYLKTNNDQQAKEILHKVLSKHIHPDLFFACANVEKTIDGRFYWINKVFEFYHLDMLQYEGKSNKVMYDNLKTNTTSKKVIAESKVSVILPVYNSEAGISTAMESMLQQTWQNFELIIVDDCSTDGTVKVIKEYMEKDSRIKLFSTERNSGPYVARNIGLTHASGEFVTVNDADDWSHSQKLEIQATHLIENVQFIANTSEQARMTEDLKLYRRGTRGKYIFSNMSSLMFRRKEVIKEIGYWDRVRFAADGEFKRRLMLVFGKNAVVDLKTGPLSLPRQSHASLTGNSAFGYDGFFMGARKEYVESFTNFHQCAPNLRYTPDEHDRLFPVPYPMLPTREKGPRHIDIVMVGDYYHLDERSTDLLLGELKKNRELGLTTGLVQMGRYNVQKNTFNKKIRNMINGQDIQMVVYGEEIECFVIIIRNVFCLQEWQQYIPKIKSITTLIVIDELLEKRYNSTSKLILRQCLRNNLKYFNKRGQWYPLDEKVKQQLISLHDTRYIDLAKETWINNDEHNEEKYALRIKDWVVDLK